ncbi:MAG TPA: class III extradiol ring-cleavage dioxygenase [Microlunatus sp.]|nr:class III extradiol ring-cleavage dioxygenase [Microlunatus sp.]
MTSLLYPKVQGGAFDDFIRDVAPASRVQRVWTPEDGPMPAVYLSHGAPPLFNDAHWIDQLFGWSESLPKPTAILIVSAHWESAPLAISSPTAGTPLVYDFGGFAPRFYEMTYETPDASGLAADVTALLSTEHLHEHPSRGLDHGAWVPLKVMYPFADVPVLQLSMPTHDPDRLLAIGRRLRPLRDRGVLIVGSGYMTHGLPFLNARIMDQNLVPGWSYEFDAWAAEALAEGAVDRLADFRGAPGMPYAHPTVEHYTPMFVTLGAATDPEAPPTTVISDFQMGLAKRSFQVA